MSPIRVLLRAIPVGVIALVLAGAGLLWFVRFEETVEVPGEVQVDLYELVRPATVGRVTEVLVEPGDRVAEGELLAVLSNGGLEEERVSLERQGLELATAEEAVVRRLRLLEEQVHPGRLAQLEQQGEDSHFIVRRAEIQVQAAAYDLEDKRNRLERLESVFTDGLVSLNERDDLRLAVLEAENQLKQSRLAVEEAQAQSLALARALPLLRSEQLRERLDLEAEVLRLHQEAERVALRTKEVAEQIDQLRLRAGLDGIVVGRRSRDLLGREVSPGEVVLSVIDPSTVFFEGTIPQTAIAHLETGQPATLEIDGLPKRRFSVFNGRVERVAQQGALEGEVRADYRIRIAVDKPWVGWNDKTLHLQDGMKGRAAILYRPDVPFLRAVYDFVLG